MDGSALLNELRNEDPDAAVIVLTGAGDIKTAIDCLKRGAHDFIMKPVDIDALLVAAERALERLREALAAHASERGVWFDSRAWVIEAHRP